MDIFLNVHFNIAQISEWTGELQNIDVSTRKLVVGIWNWMMCSLSMQIIGSREFIYLRIY